MVGIGELVDSNGVQNEGSVRALALDGNINTVQGRDIFGEIKLSRFWTANGYVHMNRALDETAISNSSYRLYTTAQH